MEPVSNEFLNLIRSGMWHILPNHFVKTKFSEQSLHLYLTILQDYCVGQSILLFNQPNTLVGYQIKRFWVLYEIVDLWQKIRDMYDHQALFNFAVPCFLKCSREYRTRIFNKGPCVPVSVMELFWGPQDWFDAVLHLFALIMPYSIWFLQYHSEFNCY